MQFSVAHRMNALMCFQTLSKNLRGTPIVHLAFHQAFRALVIRLVGPCEAVHLQDSIVQLVTLPFAISAALLKPVAVVEQWVPLMSIMWHQPVT